MDESLSAREMRARHIASITDDSKLSVDELEYILDAGLEDGVLDADERAVLFGVLSRLTAADFTPQLWNRVERLIEQYDLDGEEPAPE